MSGFRIFTGYCDSYNGKFPDLSFLSTKMGIGIDADIHHDPKLLESLHKISIKDAIPWKISLVYKKRKKSSIN